MEVYLALGSNLGDRVTHLREGIAGLRRCGLGPEALSSVWETEPVDAPGPVWFLNMAVRARTGLEPEAILDLLLDVERQVGRERGVRNAPRSLDLDLLLCEDRVVEGLRLTVPHPRMHERAFVLAPLAEIAAGVRDPRTGRTIAEMLVALPPGPALRPLGSLERLGRLPV